MRLLTLLAVLVPVAAAAQQVTATHALIKLRPGDPAPTDVVARIGAAKNELESFQAVVSGGEAGLRGASASMSDLTGPETIEARHVTLYRQAYLNIRTPSDPNGLTGRVPDALVPHVDPIVGETRNAFPFDVPPRETRVILVDVHVPPSAAPGVYTGTLTVTAAGGFSQALPVELEVFPFSLPSTPSYTTAYGLNWLGTCGGHQGSPDCGGDTARFDRLRQLYAIAGLNNRVSLSSVAGQPPTGRGAATDFTRYDAAYGPLLDGTAPTKLAGAKLTSIQVFQRDPGVAEFAAWAKHFKEKGWFDRLFDYTCDEPPLTCAWSDILPRQRALHEADPELRSLVTTSIEKARQYGILDTTDILVPPVNFVEGKRGTYQGDRSAEYQVAEERWIYASCMSHDCGATVGGEYAGGDPDLAGWPSHVVDHSAVRNRALPWVAYAKGFTGELYWDTVYAPAVRSNPWDNQFDFTGNGDGTLFYPGTVDKIGGRTEIPVESLRLKVLRDGIEDFEYLTALAAVEGEAAAAEVADALFPHAWSAADVTPERLLEVRREIAARIVENLPEEPRPATPWPSPRGPKPVEPSARSADLVPLVPACGVAGASSAPLALLILLGLALRIRRGARSE